MFILGFAGCIGALRENTFLLKFFSVFLGIIFFLELTAGVLAFVFKDWIKDQLNFFINNNIRAYRDDIDLQNLIDFTQEYFLEKHRADLLADALVSQNWINDEAYTKIQKAKTSQDQMRELYSALSSPTQKEAFYGILKEKYPWLIMEKNPDLVRDDYQEQRKSEFSTVQENHSCIGETLLLGKRYTKRSMVQKHRN
ncbi:unnamed protein product [Coregonus sp. 'balchen']|nr:unnamed protein product [Coregonus sp. 'balchen']